MQSIRILKKNDIRPGHTYACLLEPLIGPVYIQAAIWQRRKIYSNICNIR